MNQDTINRHEIKQLKEKINILESVWLSKAFSPQKRLHLNNFDEKKNRIPKKEKIQFYYDLYLKQKQFINNPIENEIRQVSK